MLTTISQSFFAGLKTIPAMASVLLKTMISERCLLTERSCTAPISKKETDSHIR